MALKTFNLDEEVYKEFSKHCKEKGISMSKKVENFIREELERMQGPVYHRKVSEKIIIDDEGHPMDKYC